MRRGLTRQTRRAIAASAPAVELIGARRVATSTGRTEQLGAFGWTAPSGTYVRGNDGPVFASGPRHLTTPCLVRNRLARQKDSLGDVTGTIEGTDIAGEYHDVQIPGLQPPDAAGYIFDNWFHVDRVDRGNAGAG